MQGDKNERKPAMNAPETLKSITCCTPFDIHELLFVVGKIAASQLICSTFDCFIKHIAHLERGNIIKH
jgi:hypothetical protein